MVIKANGELESEEDQSDAESIEEYVATAAKGQLLVTQRTLKAKCILPYVQSEFMLEKLTPFESEKPSSIVSFSQILQEQSPRKIQRSLPLNCELEQPSNFEPEHVLMPFPCDYPRKYCKEIDLVRTEPNLFVMISAQDEKRFGFERVKEFRVSNSVFDKMISSFETPTPEEFSKPKGFLFHEFREFSSSLRVSLCSNTFELFRSKTDCAFDITHPELKFLLKNVLFESSEFCKLNVNDHVSNRSLFMVNSFTSLLVLRFVKNFWCSAHVLNCELLVLRLVKDFWCSNHVLNYEKLFEVHKKQPELVSDVLIKENMFDHLRDLFIYSSRTFDVFSLVLVKAKERQVKDSKTGIVPDLANQIDYGPKKEKNQAQSHIKASKRSQRMINNFGIWNWKYLRKTTPNAQGCSILKFYLAIIFMIICLNFFVVTKLFPFDVGDLAFSQFKSTNQKQGIVVTTFSMFKDEPPDAFYMLRSNNNSQQASMIHTREKEIAFAKISSFVLKDSLIPYHTDMICLSLSKEPDTGSRAALKRMRKTEKREEYKRIKPPDLNQDKYKKISSFIQIKEAPPDATYKLNSSYNIFEGKIQMLQDYGSDFVHFIADKSDLRSNPSQVGEDDESMTSKEPNSNEQLVPEDEEANEDAKEQLEPEEADDEDLQIFNGPITRSKQAKLKTKLQHLLYTVQASLVCANPTTLVVIQAT